MRLSEEGLWDRALGQDSQMASAGPSTWHSPGLFHPSLDTCTNNERPQVNLIFSLVAAAAAAAKSLQSYPTLCDPIDGSPLGSSVPGILQARILEWVAISFSNA